MPFTRIAQSTYLDDADIDSLRAVFDRLITEHNLAPGCPAYEKLAKTIVDLYLGGERDPTEIARQAMAKRAA